MASRFVKVEGLYAVRAYDFSGYRVRYVEEVPISDGCSRMCRLKWVYYTALDGETVAKVRAYLGEEAFPELAACIWLADPYTWEWLR